MKNRHLFKAFILFITLSSTYSGHAQKDPTVVFGEPSASELVPMEYPKDSTAAAVVLYEKGYTKLKLIDHTYLSLVTEIHRKIKVLDANAYGDGIEKIYLYSPNNDRQKVTHLKAITHNGDFKVYLNSDAVFTKDIGESWKSVSFTFPNIKDQSLLEYTYQLESPYISWLQWDFQGEYPKLYSEYVTEILGNYDYSIGLRGNLEFDSHDYYIKKNCFSLEGYGDAGDCYYHQYIMKDIPAFKEEDNMLSKENYISQIRYELRESMDLQGRKERYTKDWKDIEKDVRYDMDIGKELNNEGFFTRNLPESLYSISDPLEKAKAIYYYIQKKITWNGYYHVFSNCDVKKAFENGSGSVAEINAALVSALQSANLDAYLSLSATKDFSIPTQIYPVIREFNYATAFLKIGADSYFLDATEKNTPFGLIPDRALNYTARIMDFKNGSYWQPIVPTQKTQLYFSTQTTLDEQGVLKGTTNQVFSGYYGTTIRNIVKNGSLEKYLDYKTKEYEISDFTYENLNDLEQPIKERFNVEKEMDEINGDYYVYPFFMLGYPEENPFKMEKRDYPVDFGYPFVINYLMAIDLAPSQSVSYLPPSKAFKLPDNMGACNVAFSESNGKINLRFNIQINETHFAPELYPTLKEFFAQVVKSKTNEPIIIHQN